MNNSIYGFVQGAMARNHFNTYGLGYIVDHVHDNNPGNDNGYHNTRHMMNVAVTCRNLWLAEAHPSHSPLKMRVLVAAALWHDFGHSGGKLSDAENIDIACKAMREFCREHEPVEFLDRVESLIRVTEFPFIHEPKTLLEQILRDADLLYMYSDDCGLTLYHLYGEMLNSGKLPANFTFDDMVAGQEKFMRESRMFTPTAKHIQATMMGVVVERQKRYAENLKAGHGILQKDVP